MKPNRVLAAVFPIFFTSVLAHAQPQALNPEALQDVQRLLQQMQAQRNFQLQQRGGGGRGAAPADSAQQQYALTVRNYFNALPLPGTAWWTNTALVTQLGLTDDQKAKIQAAYENHRQDIASRSESLNKEETQLSQLLQAESIDRNAVLAEIDRVTQVRSELERVNSVMTLEMREVLTRAQWMQLPGSRGLINTPFGTIVTPGAAGGLGQRNSGQRSGGGQRQQ